MGPLALVGVSSMAEAQELSARRRSDSTLRVLKDPSITTRRRPSSSTISIKTDMAKATMNMATDTTRVMIIKVMADNSTMTAATEEEDLHIKTISRNTTIRVQMDLGPEGEADDLCPAEEEAQ